MFLESSAEEEDDPISIEEDDFFRDEVILKIDNVSKRYKQKSNICQKSKYKTVLSEIQISIQKGECLGVLGPNGAGKTTYFYKIYKA